MADLLYLVHRLPFPPNKGDKVRSYHLLKHLARQHRVFLGTFVDDPEDEAHVDAIRPLCAEVHVSRLRPRLARVRSLGGLLGGAPLTLGYYRDAALARWVGETVRAHGIETAVVYSSSMAQYVDRRPGMRMVVDFVDVDSAKWSQYADAHRWPLSWLYRREAEHLLAYERFVAERARQTFFVTEAEAALFRRLAPSCSARVSAMANGVDASFFAPGAHRESPFEDDELPIVFTGAMDYWPNADAVSWFAGEVLPVLLGTWPRLRLHIVGRNPTPAVRALAGAHVSVTGTVPDVRPYLQHAALVVAPLRIARGIQNKVLEAMAMEKAVVTSHACAQAIDAVPGRDFLAAEGAAGFAECLSGLLSDPARARAVGVAARARVLETYDWPMHLARIDAFLAPSADEGVSVTGRVACAAISP